MTVTDIQNSVPALVALNTIDNSPSLEQRRADLGTTTELQVTSTVKFPSCKGFWIFPPLRFEKETVTVFVLLTVSSVGQVILVRHFQNGTP